MNRLRPVESDSYSKPLNSFGDTIVVSHLSEVTGNEHHGALVSGAEIAVVGAGSVHRVFPAPEKSDEVILDYKDMSLKLPFRATPSGVFLVDNDRHKRCLLNECSSSAGHH